MLARRLAEGAAAAQAEAERAQGQRPGQGQRTTWSPPAQPKSSARQEKSLLSEVANSSVVKQFARSAGREIARSLFGTGRRR